MGFPPAGGSAVGSSVGRHGLSEKEYGGALGGASERRQVKIALAMAQKPQSLDSMNQDWELT